MAAKSLFAAAIVLAIMVPDCLADVSVPPTTVKPRPSDMKPRLAFNPSTVESCVTTAVTLECSPKGGRTLAARIAAPKGNAVPDDNVAADNTSITSIKIFKQREADGPDDGEWEIFAEIGDTDSPSGPAADDPGVGVTGKVNGSAGESYLRVIWDVASDETYGVYRCDVMTAQNESESERSVVSTEPVALENPNNKVGIEEKLLKVLQEMQNERQKEEEWRGNVNERLERIAGMVNVLETFARGNAFKLNRIIMQVGDLEEPSSTAQPTTLPTSETTHTETTTMSSTEATITRNITPRRFASPTGEPDVAKKFVMLGVAGGRAAAATSAPVITTERRNKKRRRGDNRRRKNKKDKRRRRG
ncbi:hypothetical protein EGW08_012428 [Elysia chlorotica]|uniref:Ig-like domain-containing protein n=1 Tax=Elysia chlorotica TaxID=188477 RepID=A0A3S1B4Q1_ELYCH|nr:hypothetical protein EGW08_012428 [Elysia chlorotica]